MSYNITNWETEVLDKFEIYLDSFLMNDDISVKMLSGNRVLAWGMSEHCEIKGKVETIEGDKWVQISEISFGGVGSGVYWRDFLQLLNDTLGKMVALQTWEGGDKTVRTTIVNGYVTEENIL